MHPVAQPRRRVRAAVRARAALRRAATVHIEFGCNDTEVFWFALAATTLRSDCVVVAHDHPRLAHAPGAALTAGAGRLGSAVGYRVLSPLLDRALQRRLIRRAGLLVGFGDQAAEDLSAAGARAVEVIPHGSDPAPAGAPAPSAGESVLFAGFIGPSKGLDVLLAAWGEVGAGLGLPLLIAGAAPPPNDVWLAGLLAAHPAEPAPQLLGPVPGEAAFQGLVARAAIVVAPYRSSSPASGVIARAMGAGRAIIATPVPAVQGLIRDGESGLLVAPGDARALAEALRRLAGDPDLRDRLGAAAARTAGERLSWDAHLDGLERAYARAGD